MLLSGCVIFKVFGEGGGGVGFTQDMQKGNWKNPIRFLDALSQMFTRSDDVGSRRHDNVENTRIDYGSFRVKTRAMLAVLPSKVLEQT